MRDNIIKKLKEIEPGYNKWTEQEINKQIDAIYECGYVWEENYGGYGFKHKKTGFYLNIPGLHLYNPEQVKETYKNVWAKDYHGIKLKHHFWKSIKGIPILIISLIIGLIIFKLKTVLIINSLILTYILYHFFMFKYHRKKNYEEIMQDNDIDTNEITWCGNCIHFKDVKNWLSDKIYLEESLVNISNIPCQIPLDTMELWKEYFKTPQGERYLYPKNCKFFVKK